MKEKTTFKNISKSNTVHNHTLNFALYKNYLTYFNLLIKKLKAYSIVAVVKRI